VEAMVSRRMLLGVLASGLAGVPLAALAEGQGHGPARPAAKPRPPAPRPAPVRSTVAEYPKPNEAGTAEWASGGESGQLTSGAPTTIPLEHGDNTITVTHDNAGVILVYTLRMRRGGVMTSLVFSTPGVTMTPAFSTAQHTYVMSDEPYEQTTLSYTVAGTFDTAGYLQCDQCDWWQYESRGTQMVALEPGANCIDWTSNPGVDGVPAEHYYIKVSRGPVNGVYSCP